MTLAIIKRKAVHFISFRVQFVKQRGRIQASGINKNGLHGPDDTENRT